jgi:hypothetical protein
MCLNSIIAVLVARGVQMIASGADDVKEYASECALVDVLVLVARIKYENNINIGDWPMNIICAQHDDFVVAYFETFSKYDASLLGNAYMLSANGSASLSDINRNASSLLQAMNQSTLFRAIHPLFAQIFLDRSIPEDDENVIVVAVVKSAVSTDLMSTWRRAVRSALPCFFGRPRVEVRTLTDFARREPGLKLLWSFVNVRLALINPTARALESLRVEAVATLQNYLEDPDRIDQWVRFCISQVPVTPEPGFQQRGSGL